MIVIGVDPGGKHTGLVVRHGDQLIHYATVTRATDQQQAVHLARVIDALLDGDEYGHPGDDWLVAVENVADPNPHLGVIALRGLLDTAAVLGAVLSWVQTDIEVSAGATRADLVVVEPGGHGSGPLAAYPKALRPTRGQDKGKDALRHVRSAWDIAAAGLAQWRLERAAFADKTDSVDPQHTDGAP